MKNSFFLTIFKLLTIINNWQNIILIYRMYHKLIYEERQKKYHDWFLIHSGMQKKINLKESQEEKEIGMNLDEKWSYISLDNNNVPDIDKIKSQTYEEWFSRHCVKGIDDRILIHNDNDNMSILSKTDFHDNAACYQSNKIKEEDFLSFYTSICKKFYPLILDTNSKIYDKICNNNFKEILSIALHVITIFV